MRRQMRSKAAFISWESRRLCWKYISWVEYNRTLSIFLFLILISVWQKYKCLTFLAVTYWHQTCFPLATKCFAAWNGSEVMWNHQQMSTSLKGKIVFFSFFSHLVDLISHNMIWQQITKKKKNQEGPSDWEGRDAYQ